MVVSAPLLPVTAFPTLAEAWRTRGRTDDPPWWGIRGPGLAHYRHPSTLQEPWSSLCKQTLLRTPRPHLIHHIPCRNLSLSDASSASLPPPPPRSCFGSRPRGRPLLHPQHTLRTQSTLYTLRGLAPYPGSEWHILPLNRWVATWCLGPGAGEGHLPASPFSIIFHPWVCSSSFLPYFIPLLPPFPSLPPPLSIPSSLF